MKKMAFLCFFYLGALCAQNSLELHVDNNQSLFVVTLPANPTTGYQWQIKSYDKNLVTLKDSQYVKSSTAIGGGGTMIYQFSLINGKNWPKSTSLTFTYLRPWEKNQGTDTVVTVYFDPEK